MQANFQDEQKIVEILESMLFALPCIVKKVFPVRMRADVVLKIKRVTGQGKNKQETDGPWVYEVPIMHYKNTTHADRKLPKAGNPAWLVFHDRSLEEVIKDLEQRDPKQKRMHHENDPILIGEWLYDTEDLKMPAQVGSMTAYDWLLALHRVNWGRIYQRKNGDAVIHVAPGGRVELIEDASHPVAFADRIAAKYNPHLHFDMPGPCGGPPLPAFIWFPISEWTLNVFSDNSFVPSVPIFTFVDTEGDYGNTTDDGSY